MKVTRLLESDCLVLEVFGCIDTITAPELESAFKGALDGIRELIFDFSGVDYVSSAGLRTLKRLHMAMKKKNGSLVLTNVRKMVMEVFEMTGFAGLLNFE